MRRAARDATTKTFTRGSGQARMTNVELVVKKLAMIDEHLRRLRERRPADVEALRSLVVSF